MSLPPGYHDSLAEAEERHWWAGGMRAIAGELVRLRRPDPGSLLDAGCGTGGFLAWASTKGFAPLAGVDPAVEAITAARSRVPEADLRVAELALLPFPDASFAVVACNDVLQHVVEQDAAVSLRELRRVVRPDGVLLVRTNGGRRALRAGPDWRLFDRATLERELEEAGFRCVRLSYANVLGSALAAARGQGPRPPSPTSHGIPSPSRRPRRLLSRLLQLEGRLIRRGVRLPFGHTLVALATPVPAPSSTTRSPVSAER